MLSNEQKENVKTQIFSRLLQAVKESLISKEEFRESCNQHDLLGIILEEK